MAEPKDTAIKLFGKTILLQDTPYGDDNADDEHDDSNKLLNQQSLFPPTISEHNLILDGKENDMADPDKQTFRTTQVGVSLEVSDKTTNQDASLGEPDIPEALSVYNERVTWKSSKIEEEKSESSASQDKNPRKPDKVLPCPRCKSMDTKFCYYNNYNVNQPRHLCKNCQRYWTSDGTMRNVPIGAGCRKSKNMMSHYHHITIPEALHNTRSDIPVEVHSTLPINGSVCTCNFDVSHSESMSSILNPTEKSSRNCQPNDIDGSNSKDEASQSFVREAMSAGLNCIPVPNQIPCYPGSPWPYPLNYNQWSPPVAAPPFCPNGFSMPIYPTPTYWGCTVPGTWNIPWITQSSPTSTSSPSSSPNSRFGKRSRDGNVLCSAHCEENNFEQSPWFPKTSRFHNPGEVAKSSVWTTLGSNHNEKCDSIRRGSALFKGFKTKHVEGNSQVDTSAVLEVNPTALSMSQNFQENSSVAGFPPDD